MLYFIFCCYFFLSIVVQTEEFIPVKPVIPARLQPNWEQISSNEPGISIGTDCGCVGCCSLQPETIYETIVLPSTNFCFFTAILTTTTDTTVTKTSTLTSTTTKVTTLKMIETVSKVTTQSVIQVSLNPITLTKTVKTVLTQTQYTARNSLSIIGSTVYISRTPTRVIKDFIPFDVFSSILKTITFTTFLLTISQSTTTITKYSGTPTFGILTTTSTSTLSKGKPEDTVTITLTFTSTIPDSTTTEYIFDVFTDIEATISLNLITSTNLEFVTYSTSVVNEQTYYLVTGPFYTTIPFTEVYTYSYLP
jgi:hypothetical protein